MDVGSDFRFISEAREVSEGDFAVVAFAAATLLLGASVEITQVSVTAQTRDDMQAALQDAIDKVMFGESPVKDAIPDLCWQERTALSQMLQIKIHP